MSEWKDTRLGDICTIVGRIGFRGYTAKDLVETSDKGAISLSPTNIANFELNLSKVTYISWEKYYESPEIMVAPGDIVFSKTGTVGWSALIKEVVHPITLNPQLVVFKDIKINPVYLSYVMRSHLFKELVKNITGGSAVPTLTQKDLGNIEFPVADSETQEKIASILSSLDDKIAVNKKICENLEAQAQALFKHWFVDFAPFKDGKFIESELGMIPEGWDISNIYEYIDVIYGAPYKSSLFNDKKNGLPLIRIRDLKTYSPQFYTPEVLPTTEYIEAGDVVAGMDAEFIPYIWLGERGVLNQRCCKFKGKDNRISNYYILFLVKPELVYVQSYKTGTTVSHLGKSDIDRFRVVTPPLDVILSFSDIVDSMKKEVVTRAKESLRLSTLRDTLLPKLMSGELKLNEINI